MTEKEILTILIKQKGGCIYPVSIACTLHQCIFKNKCRAMNVPAAENDFRYKLAIEIFKEKYGNQELLTLLLT